MSLHLKNIHIRYLDFWYARASVIVVVGLQLLIINHQGLLKNAPLVAGSGWGWNDTPTRSDPVSFGIE